MRKINSNLGLLGALLLFVTSFSFGGTFDNASYEELVLLSQKADGEIHADYSAVYIPSSDKTYYEALFWNTSTGESKLYYYNFTDSKFKAYADNVQIPDNPLGSRAQRGDIMMDYTAVHIPSSDKTYYEVLVWDTKTGNSVLYYYNFTDKAFKAYADNVQLPENPLGRTASGDIWMDYSSVHVPSKDKTYYEVIVWDRKTGYSRLYYYNYTDKKFKMYGDKVQLPTYPLGSTSSSDIMIDYTAIHVPSDDKTHYEALVWDTKTGKSRLYYYNYSEETFKVYADNVQLPTNPLNSVASGKVMMDYTCVYIPSSDKTYYEILVWDENTGESVLYYYNYTDKVFKAYADNVQLSSSPLTGVQGKYVMDYTAVHVPTKDKTYYEILVYDSFSGKSLLYYYSFDDKKFKAYGSGTQFPARPLAD